MGVLNASEAARIWQGGRNLASGLSYMRSALTCSRLNYVQRGHKSVARTLTWILLLVADGDVRTMCEKCEEITGRKLTAA